VLFAGERYPREWTVGKANAPVRRGAMSSEEMRIEDVRDAITDDELRYDL
jgi:hypothetical protein